MNSDFLRVLTEKSFLYLWIGEILTQVSTHLFNFFLIILVFKLTQSNTAVSGVVISFTVPAILFGSIAGVYVDHWDKKKVMIVSNILRGVILLLLSATMNWVFMVYFACFFFSVIAQFFIPAESPMIPKVVKEEYLMAANALFGLAIFGSMLIAYVLSGPLLLLLHPVKMGLFIALLLFISAAVISLIKPKYNHHKDTHEEKELNIFKDLRNTFRVMSRTKEIVGALMFLALSQILVLILAAIAPGYATQILKIPVEEFPLIFVAPAAFGMVIGAIIIVNFLRFRNRNKIITIGLFLSGIAMMLMPYGSKVASKDFVQFLNTFLPDITTLHIMSLLAFVLGLANAFVFVPANTLLQEKTPEALRGKIYGFLSTIVGVLSVLPILVVGGLSDLIGVGAVITGIGVILFLLGITQFFV